ncbi:SDR family NAD(P)-dependent oxidoreductase [Erythrobacter sp. SCSIO 43205]|uniref:SDR family NAD(P)-dependent oxidoreductase n=1 Tax=Erythrobacter sp. SCSIO 43205 TaxID=2779361 RepID=UPI001CA9F9A7|nr:SDR family NAD(P)-dependent oxidoreductase [Erythrobacter sp. SCSIO 43205]UAB78135.1 SDR family NAD(P)-dependent oxidoreductase [Erythrobacter sp. SCSIO 43205]
MSEFGATTTTDEVLEDKDLSGKTVFITGGSSGLGQETARAMAAKGAHVIIAARNPKQMEEAVAAIKSDVPDAELDTLTCDLASLESIKEAGKQANDRFEKIDILINNAGVMACPKMETADGFEMQFGTNHLGHFALTKHLMPLVEAGGDKRIVNLSSRGHHFAPTDLDDPNFEKSEYTPWISYGRSKTANVLFTRGLEDRFADKGIHAYAVHPGGIQTNLGRHLTQEDMAFLRKRMEEQAKKAGKTSSFKSILEGAATQVWAATAAELEGKGGVYCEDCNVAEVDDTSTTGGVRSYALDKGEADRLWALSQEMTGETFD